MPEPGTPRPAPGASRPGARPAGTRPPGARPGGNPEGPNAGPRAEFSPEKKKGPPPAVILSLLAAIVVAAGVFGWAILRKQKIEAQPPKTVVSGTNEPEWAGIKEKIREARRRFKETMDLRTDEEQAKLFQKKLEETIAYITGVREEIDAMLESVRDKETGLLPPEYNGYNHEARELVTMVYDLSKASPFGLTPEGE